MRSIAHVSVSVPAPSCDARDCFDTPLSALRAFGRMDLQDLQLVHVHVQSSFLQSLAILKAGSVDPAIEDSSVVMRQEITSLVSQTSRAVFMSVGRRKEIGGLLRGQGISTFRIFSFSFHMIWQSCLLKPYGTC